MVTSVNREPGAVGRNFRRLAGALYPTRYLQSHRRQIETVRQLVSQSHTGVGVSTSEWRTRLPRACLASVVRMHEHPSLVGVCVRAPVCPSGSPCAPVCVPVCGPRSNSDPSPYPLVLVVPPRACQWLRQGPGWSGDQSPRPRADKHGRSLPADCESACQNDPPPLNVAPGRARQDSAVGTSLEVRQWPELTSRCSQTT